MRASLHFMAVVLAVCSIASCAYPAKQLSSTTKGPPNYEMYVVHHGWHTGLVLPAQEFHYLLPQLRGRFPHSLYLEFGWGDEAFYQAERVTVGLALRALFWPTDSVMHVVGLSEHPEIYFASNAKEKRCLNQQQYHALVDFIMASFLRNSAQEILPLELGLYGDSQFYKALGKYHFLHTCNTWTARALQRIGMPITPTLMVTAQTIMNYLRSEEGRGGNVVSCE